MLASKSRNHPDVIQFYQKYKPDTSRIYMHTFKDAPGLGIYLNPYDKYQSIFQVGIDEDYKGAMPFGLRFGMTEAEVAAKTGLSFAVKPSLFNSMERMVVIKGGVAFSLSFIGNKLTSVTALISDVNSQNTQNWEAIPFLNYKEGCILGDCKNGASLLANNKDVYVGSLLGGIRNGYGQMYYRDRTYFQGTFENGIRKNGVYYFASGKYFSGDFNKEGEMMNGTLNYLNGDIFKGSFSNNKPFNGTMNFKSGNVYTGSFNESGKFVNGKYSVVGIGTFEGQFIGDNQPYTGTMTLPNGTKSKIENGVKIK